MSPPAHSVSLQQRPRHGDSQKMIPNHKLRRETTVRQTHRGWMHGCIFGGCAAAVAPGPAHAFFRTSLRKVVSAQPGVLLLLKCSRSCGTHGDCSLLEVAAASLRDAPPETVCVVSRRRCATLCHALPRRVSLENRRSHLACCAAQVLQGLRGRGWGQHLSSLPSPCDSLHCECACVRACVCVCVRPRVAPSTSSSPSSCDVPPYLDGASLRRRAPGVHTGMIGAWRRRTLQTVCVCVCVCVCVVWRKRERLAFAVASDLIYLRII